MKILSRSIKFFFIFLAVAVLALFAFVVTFDANNYKPQIIEQVEKATGRDFTIDGEINLSVFPWVGLKVEDAALGNDERFKAEKFAAIKQLDIKVNLLPLIKKEVQINTIRLHGLDVSLEVAKDKSNNWSSLAQADAEAEPEKKEADEQPSAEKPAAVSPLQSLMVEGLEFVDAVIRYDDRSTNTQATVSELNLTTSAIEFGQAVDVKFGARVENNQPAIDTRLSLTTQLSFDKAFSKIDLHDFIFKIFVSANEFVKQDEEFEIKTDINVLMEEQRITLKPLTISAMGTTTKADITVTEFKETPLVLGDLEVLPFNARALAKRAGVELPEMAKADALNKVALKTNIRFQGEKLQADALHLTMDSSTLTGWLQLLNISNQQLRYELAFDQLNLNDYLPPVAEAPVAEKAPATAGAGQATAAADAATGDEKIELPVEMMRKLNVQGDFRIASLLVKEYDIKQFLMTIKAQSGDIAIKPLSLRVLQGQVKSALNVNVQKDTPAYAINLDVDKVQMGPVVNPFLDGIMGDKPMSMKGAADVVMDIKTTGDTVNQLKKASKGQIKLDMKETEVNGFDPEFYMRSSVADYLQGKGFGKSKTVMGSYSPREVTVFDKIHSTVNLADGKARTDDFIMDSKRVQVTAEGHVDIMQDTLDIVSATKLPRGKTTLEKVLDSPLYVHVHGPFTALEYDLDTDRLKKSTTDVLKKQANEKIDAEKQRLKAKAKEKAEAEKRRAEEKAKQELKKSTDKYQDKLKDKLKGLF